MQNREILYVELEKTNKNIEHYKEQIRKHAASPEIHVAKIRMLLKSLESGIKHAKKIEHDIKFNSEVKEVEV